MQIQKFEDILAWQKSKEITLQIYLVFKYNKDFSFRDQIQRASVSIMNNIAEGFERRSNKEFKQFLYISKGSCGELRSMLYLALELCYVSEEKYANLNERAIEVSKMLSGFIKTL